MEIGILRIGPVRQWIYDHICRSLQSFFPEANLNSFREVMPLPGEAYNSSRNQYDSSILLSKLSSYLPSLFKVDKLLGVTEADLFVPKMNFVFGEARPKWGIAVISLHRLRPEFYGQILDNEIFAERFTKEAIHEIGHTLGLRHCGDQQCVMFFSNNIQLVDKKDLNFCVKCKKHLKNSFKNSCTSKM